MNAGVALVQAYLHLNGYFTVVELPVIRHHGGGYAELTDLDILAVRFPGASQLVARGRPGPEDDLRLGTDPALGASPDAVDVLIAEVKEGKARLNDALRTPDALHVALARVGCVPPGRETEVVDALRRRGEVRLDPPASPVPVRIRLGAFGSGHAGARPGYRVFDLHAVAGFVREHLDRYHDVLHPADLGDPALGLLHLLRKLEPDR